MRPANFPVLITALTAKASPRPPSRPDGRKFHGAKDHLPQSSANPKSTFLQIQIDTHLPISDKFFNIPFVPNAGGLTLEPGYPFTLRVTFVQGSNYLRHGRDGQHVHLDVASTGLSDESGSLALFNYNGVVVMTGDEGRLIREEEDATTTTGFGNDWVSVFSPEL